MRAPSPPDPYQTAAAQGAANRDASIAGALINNINENSPLGSVRYTQSGTSTYTDPTTGKQVTVPQFTRDVKLSSQQNWLYNQQMEAASHMNALANQQIIRLGNTMGKPFTTNGLPSAVNSITNPTLNTNAPGPSDFSADRQRVEDAIFARQNTQFDRDEAAMRQRLASQGLTPGSEAYNGEVDRFNQAKTDARTQAILAGGEEQSRLFNMAVGQQQAQNAALGQQFNQNAQAGDFRNAARQNAFTESLAVRNQPINEVSALLGGGQVSMPQFQQPYRQAVGAAPVGAYINQDYQNRLSQYNSGMSGLFGIGSSLIGGLFGLSDRRTKTDIQRVGRTDAGLPVYTFRYRGDPKVQMGVMADEVERQNPDAVVRDGGLKYVDYAQVA